MKIKASEAVPGQWYEDEDGVRRLCVHQSNSIMNTLLYGRNGRNKYFVDHQELTHLPDCTGWDWRPPNPEKRYRAFANAKEFKPHRDKWVDEYGRLCRVQVYCNSFVEANDTNYDWDLAFERLKFEGGEPFGMEVSE